MDSKPVEPSLQLRLLGSPQVRLNGRPLEIARRKAQALLYYLATNPEFQQRATLATLLWPESDQQYASGSFRRHLSDLNRQLGPGWLETEQNAVRLARRTNLWVDIEEFQCLLAMCQEHGHPTDMVCSRCIEPLTAAVSLYQDDFLAGFTLPDTPDFDSWQLFKSEELRFTFATTLDRLIEAYQAQDNLVEAIPIARRRLNLDPLHEPAQRQLMRLYAASGQHAAALRQYAHAVQILKTELDVPPDSETRILYEEIQRGEFTRTPSALPTESDPSQTVRHNLVAPTTPLVGRTAALKDIGNLCADPTHRLITILGPGGIGKTRLALAVARQVVEEFAQNIFMVHLARLREPTTIIPAVADALNFQFQADGRASKEQLFAYLAPKQLYLVLDNFEHLLEGVHLVQELLERCPYVRLLVTSRERLKLTGETVYTLHSLAFPTWETPKELQSYDAVQLFIETTQRVRPTLVFQAEEMQYVARICRLVGGMPLGIILAATWVEHLSPATIATELTKGFDLLETELHDLPERQRSMQAILDYSWQSLTAKEQDVFMRLAIFQGGFTRVAAQVVAEASLPDLVHLVDKSFVQSVAGERYEIHELLRQYAQQRLEIAEELTTTQCRHGTYYLKFMHQSESDLAGPDQLSIIAELEADFENIRSAWQWAVRERQYGLVDRALDGLFRWMWLRRSRQQEGLELLQLAHQRWRPAPGSELDPVWGRITVRMIKQQGPWLLEVSRAQERTAQALEIARLSGNRAEIAFCKWATALAIVSQWRDTPFIEYLQPAIPLYQASLDYYSKQDPFWQAQLLEHLGHCYRLMGEVQQARTILQESLVLRRDLNDRFGLARTWRELGFLAFVQGFERETEEAWQMAQTIQHDLGDKQGIADSQFFLSVLAIIRSDWQRASTVANHVMAVATEMQNPFYQRWAARALEITRSMAEVVDSSKQHSHTFPNALSAFTARFSFFLFTSSPSALWNQLYMSLMLATTDVEYAVCLTFAAKLFAQNNNKEQGVRFLSLAFRYPEVAEGWVGKLPDIVELQRRLQSDLPESVFRGTWREGSQLNLQHTVAELQQALETILSTPGKSELLRTYPENLCSDLSCRSNP